MSRRTQKNVGVIGLGIIGSRVREVLRRKGFHAFVWNRTPKPVPNFVGAPAELAEMCDCIQIFVSDDEALLDVVRQLAPGIGARHVIVAHPTVAPHSMIAAAEIVERRGARFVEAPFTGSKEAAENGQLVYYLGGTETALREARPFLEASSKGMLAIGEIGQATIIKIATNMVTAASIQSAAEAMALVQASGLPLARFGEAMKGNASNSKTLDLKLPKMVAGDFEAHFSVKHMLKDMQIASRMGLSHHLELGITSSSRDRLLEQMQRGHGDEDYSAVARKYFSLPPSEAAEAGLELFEPPPSGAVETPWVPWTATSDEGPAVIHAVPQPHEEHRPEPGEPVSVAVTPIAEVAQPTNGSADENVIQDEPDERRGFLGRLLRRESHS
jgi:3-hydroxyisobutyrate dehydrogenase-like beta-hydroxyacid dehydrogenase